MLTIFGKIKFPGGKNPEIPDGSTLTVKFEDTNRMDVASVTLGKLVKTITGYDGSDLTFNIKDASKPPNGPEATISAVLTMGWVPSGDEWIRKGDYLSDTRHSVLIKSGESEYNVDVEVVKY